VNLVQGPDFPTGGFILGRQGILDYFTKGRGTLKLRAKAATESFGKDREAIVVTEIPYQVNKARLIEAAAGMVNDKKLEGISEIRDESDRDGMRIVFELKRGEQAEVILNNLYKHTQLQINFGVIMLSIVNGQPRELGLLDVLKRFIDHRIDVVRRRTDFLLRKAREREHILLGFQKALENMDAVIKLIRASKTPKEARDGLIGSFTFTERQAQAIIEMQLQRLTGMEIQKILDELAEIQKQIAEYLDILGSDKRLRAVITQELKDVQKEFGDERRTQIIEDTGEILLEDLIQVEDVAVTVTHRCRHLPAPNARRQRPDRHGHSHRGRGRTPGGRFHARLSAGLHHQGPGLLAEDLRDSRRRNHRKRETHFEPLQFAAGRSREDLPAGEGFRRGPEHRHGDQARRDQEVRGNRIRQSDVARHHRALIGRRRRTAGRAPDQHRQLHLSRHARGQSYPIP
jgi:DNA gyrase subunit A